MKLLLAVEQSQYSEAAIRIASELYGKSENTVRVLHVVDPQINAEADAMAVIESASRFVHDTVVELKRLMPACDVTGDYSVGTPGRIILEWADKEQPDCIIVGSHGRTGLTRLLLGSVSRMVLTHTKYPVLIARQSNCKGTDDNFKILVATDNSEESDFAFDRMLTHSWPANSMFCCATAIAALDENSSLDTDEGRARSWLKCCEVRLQVTTHAAAVTSELLLGTPEETIVERAKDWPADLIVLGSRAPAGLERLLHGSVSESVVTHSPCSVLVLPMSKATAVKEVCATTG